MDFQQLSSFLTVAETEGEPALDELLKLAHNLRTPDAKRTQVNVAERK